MNRLQLMIGYNELTKALRDYVLKHNIKYKTSPEAPNNYKDLCNYMSDNDTFLVYDGGDHGWLGQNRNCLFRAVHDHGHITEGLSFKFDDERELGKLQAVQLATMPSVDKRYREVVRQIVLAEINGQIDYYKNNGHYVTDQRQFILEYFGL